MKMKKLLLFGLSGITFALLINACVTPPVVTPQSPQEIVVTAKSTTQAIPTQPSYDDTDMVDVTKVMPDIVLDIRYATTNNFLGQKIYNEPRCLLRWAAAKRLIRVQEALKEQGLGLKVFDCYRPPSAQRKMWAIKPDPNYVANPDKGSRHNRGMAVDLTLVDANKQELVMPTGFDDFSLRAHRDAEGHEPSADR